MTWSLRFANEGMSLLDNRNKLIFIADQDGWNVVEYFQADPLTKNDEEEKKLCLARKEAERSREKQNGKNSLRSKMETRFKSQPTSSKRGARINFGPSHKIVDFCPDICQLLVSPVPEKKLQCITALVAAKPAISLRIVKFPLPLND